MSAVPKPQIECEQHHATLSVQDVRAAVDFYTNKLGFWLAFAEGDPPTFAGVNLGHVQILSFEGSQSNTKCSRSVKGLYETSTSVNLRTCAGSRSLGR